MNDSDGMKYLDLLPFFFCITLTARSGCLHHHKMQGDRVDMQARSGTRKTWVNEAAYLKRTIDFDFLF
jgi:hypothetical protein